MLFVASSEIRYIDGSLNACKVAGQWTASSCLGVQRTSIGSDNGQSRASIRENNTEEILDINISSFVRFH